MTVDFITTEALTDDQILTRLLHYSEGKFSREDFFESIEGSLDVYGSSITDSSKEEIIKQLRVLLAKLLEEI